MFTAVFYGTKQNVTEKPIYIFGIKTMFTGVSQSLAWSVLLFSMDLNGMEWKDG